MARKPTRPATKSPKSTPSKPSVGKAKVGRVTRRPGGVQSSVPSGHLKPKPGSGGGGSSGKGSG